MILLRPRVKSKISLISKSYASRLVPDFFMYGSGIYIQEDHSGRVACYQDCWVGAGGWREVMNSHVGNDCLVKELVLGHRSRKKISPGKRQRHREMAANR